MDIINFSTKENNYKYEIKNALKSILMIAAFALIFHFINLKTHVSNSVLYFFLALSYFLQTFVFSKKTLKGVKQILINDTSIKLAFFNSFKEPVTFSLETVGVQIDDNTIKFYKKENGKLVGVAYRHFLTDGFDWGKVNLLINSKLST